MKTIFASAALALCLMSASLSVISATAATTSKMSATKKPAEIYECTKCHMKFSAAMAKKDHYKDAMDGGTLMPVKAAPKASGSSGAAKASAPKSSSTSSMGM